jgi:hypothetical protein
MSLSKRGTQRCGVPPDGLCLAPGDLPGREHSLEGGRLAADLPFRASGHGWGSGLERLGCRVQGLGHAVEGFVPDRNVLREQLGSTV